MHTQNQNSSVHSNGALKARVRRTQTGHLIEPGVPIPRRDPIWLRGAGGGRKRVLDLSGLAVGDSVFVSAKTKPALTRARANAYQAGKRDNVQITARAVEGGIRVWRVA